MTVIPVRLIRSLFVSALAVALLSPGSLILARAESKLTGATIAKVDAATQRVLAATGAPSASIAIVKDDQTVYLQAYGSARLEPHVAARPEMRYSIGSVSKQFTATAILMLREEGKLSMDDPVSRFLPTLARANEVTIRQLLSHTCGYQDYWPQDYVPPFMLHEITADQILDRWARKPLDFDPGTQWQYSNTNFVIAGLIVEKVSGMPLLQFLRSRIFSRLDMQSVLNIDQERLHDTDAAGYLRYALGPPRIAPKEGKGWLFAAGELAMPAKDLARWDISILQHSLLQPASYRQMETEVLLKNGLATEYGLGLHVKRVAGHRALEHQGEVSGFTTENMVFPDDHAAVIVMVNQDSVEAAPKIAEEIAALILAEQNSESLKLERDRQIFRDLQQGKIDRSLFTDNANAYFTEQAIGDFASSLAPLGMPLQFSQKDHEERGGMTFRSYTIKFRGRTLEIWTRETPDGKLEQYQVLAKE
jgi:CubicO group peptidase (beta-lactamase class C family)